MEDPWACPMPGEYMDGGCPPIMGGLCVHGNGHSGQVWGRHGVVVEGLMWCGVVWCGAFNFNI